MITWLLSILGIPIEFSWVESIYGDLTMEVVDENSMKFLGVSFGLVSTWWTSGTSYLHADQHAIVFSPNFATDNMMFVGNDGGIAMTTNPFATVQTNPCTGSQTTTWTQKNDGYGTLQVSRDCRDMS